MEIELTQTVRVVCDDGRNWTLEELRTWESKEANLTKSGWRTVGHYSRLDQACARALDVCAFPRDVDKIVVGEVVKRIAEAKSVIIQAIGAIDARSLEAANSKGSKRKVRG